MVEIKNLSVTENNHLLQIIDVQIYIHYFDINPCQVTPLDNTTFLVGDNKRNSVLYCRYIPSQENEKGGNCHLGEISTRIQRLIIDTELSEFKTLGQVSSTTFNSPCVNLHIQSTVELLLNP